VLIMILLVFHSHISCRPLFPLHMSFDWQLWNLSCISCKSDKVQLSHKLQPFESWCDLWYMDYICIMLQTLNDVMKMELIEDKQCGEIKQVRCYCVCVFHSVMYFRAYLHYTDQLPMSILFTQFSYIFY
jgi:hypothetical protein